jgi:hypothetical protein
MILTFLPGIGKYLIGNAVCSFDSSDMQLIYIFALSDSKQCLLQTPRKK